jgi:hypothetical protein
MNPERKKQKKEPVKPKQKPRLDPYKRSHIKNNDRRGRYEETD